MSSALLGLLRPLAAATVLGAAPTFSAVCAQGTIDDYRRALTLEARYAGLVVNVADNVRWIDDSRFSFRRSERGGHRFFVLNVATAREEPAFDHARLATALSPLAGRSVAALTLPFENFTFTDGGSALQAIAQGGQSFRCTLPDYRCTAAAGSGGRGGGRGGAAGGAASQQQAATRVSPDGKLEALVQNYNLIVRAVGTTGPLYFTHDGSEGNAYTLQSVSWAPDSRRLAVYRVVPGHERLVHYVESSPADQLQPRHFTRNYTKPGDVLDVRRPVLIDLDASTEIVVDDALFANAYSVSALQWRRDGREFTFEYNQRGHDVYRVVGVDGKSGAARAIIDEVTKSFFYYRPASGDGKYFRSDLNDGREIIWMSERDGWNHLYLFEGLTGRVKQQITKGEWVVRDVMRVDEANRQIYFAASGRHADQDPYFVHYYRIGFDGRGLTALSEAHGNHTISFSPDGRHYVLSWSRVDLPPVSELRRTEDRQLLATFGRGDHSALLAAGWKTPEVFVARGRDGVTDIWGVILRPSNFDSTRTYPVVESIYAGPHSNHVPKSFAVFPSRGMVPQAELGFIVVQIDGMGTSNRSKKFHDVAWKNLGDAGFPDRILWHKAVGQRYRWYDLSRVGIYGGSAGGQNAMGALLFHGDFYHAAVADNGCHDNRMDKIWWNELWMSWPLGPHYSASSNVDNAHKLRGKLLLTVSELDSNVDPSSTYQVANALIKARKEFEFLMIPGGEHARGPYHERKRFDFFVRHLLGGKPPDWNTSGIASQSDER
jgi:dipeptidyl aminopeptidase/acylaminoacyl peptidase